MEMEKKKYFALVRKMAAEMRKKGIHFLRVYSEPRKGGMYRTKFYGCIDLGSLPFGTWNENHQATRAIRFLRKEGFDTAKKCRYGVEIRSRVKE